MVKYCPGRYWAETSERQVLLVIPYLFPFLTVEPASFLNLVSDTTKGWHLKVLWRAMKDCTTKLRFIIYSKIITPVQPYYEDCENIELTDTGAVLLLYALSLPSGNNYIFDWEQRLQIAIYYAYELEPKALLSLFNLNWPQMEFFLLSIIKKDNLFHFSRRWFLFRCSRPRWDKLQEMSNGFLCSLW